MSGVLDSQKDIKMKQLVPKAYQDRLTGKLVAIRDVVQNFIDLEFQSEGESVKLKELTEMKVVDAKWAYLVKIVNEKCKTDDIRALNSLITALTKSKHQNNIEIAMDLKLLYDERKYLIEVTDELNKEKLKIIADLQQKTQKYCDNMKRKEAEVVKLRKEIEHLLETSNKLKTQIQELQTRTSEKEKLIKHFEVELEEITNMNKNLQAQVHKKTNETDSKENQLGQKEEEIQRANHENIELRSEIKCLRDKIKEKEETIIMLRQQRTMSRKDVEDEIRNVFDEHKRNMDEQIAIIKRQNEEIAAMKLFEKVLEQSIEIYRRNLCEQCLVSVENKSVTK